MILILSLVFIGIGILLFCLKYLFSFSREPKLTPPGNLKPNFAVLIPARDESKVIEDLFKSLKNQTYKVDPSSVYVIIESESDPTVAIAKEYHFKTIIRQHPEKQRKGYALSEAVCTILKQKQFDLYFIFDADNKPDKDFFKEMLQTYEKGYDIGIGCRKIKNLTNATAVGSGLIFTIVNVLMNRTYSRRGLNCVASGTGYYISGRIINHLKDFPFHTMTEDYEISLYAAIHNYSTFYNKKALFYDTQPETYSQYFLQRARWEKGYFEARRRYSFKLLKNSCFTLFIGVYDFIFIVLGLILLLINFAIINPIFILIELTAIYLILMFFTALLLKVERYPLSFSLKLKTLLLHPLLLLTYIPCLFVVIFKRDLAWHRINH